ncbi:fungal-specific transcription factor domain-containing protein [Aspergillus avenaceus]|uniref:Fungal-specific transcription factor domain-containing protein n=1 Tax=Aspergillus avenaceus TaxID=36643 RepID=A0A5N6TQ38_ASPAV|nr:fungal-specific transcription factor domain-containing protein [Aspergillus avenaceus]
MPPVKPSKRRHATMACVPCRESKIKCDGKDPPCSNCANRKRECRYEAVDRRKLPLRVAIELLLNRVDQLCCFIQMNELEPPSMSQEKHLALRTVLENLGLADASPNLAQQGSRKIYQAANTAKGTSAREPNSQLATVNSPVQHGPERPETQVATGNSYEDDFLQDIQLQDIHVFPTHEDDSPVISLTTDHQNITRANPTDESNGWNWELGLETCITPVSPEIQHVLNPSPGETFQNTLEEAPEPFEILAAEDDRTLVDDSSSAEDVEGLIDELSDRVGTLHIGPGGQTHFYGPTSTFNLAGIPVFNSAKTCRTVHHETSECLLRLKLNKELPATLETHLINLYFAWQDPSFHAVDRKMYEEAKRKWYAKEETPFYSEALRNAMCCLGAAYEARYHPELVTFPRTLVDYLAARAKATLEVELDYPCVATVQAMVVLSSHEIGNGKDARGWLYSGMAIRLAFDLALHLDMSSYVSSGTITSNDADLRRTVFWAAYIVDHQLGFYRGRPFRTNMEDVTVSKLDHNASPSTFTKWVPYACPSTVRDSTGLLDYTGAVSQQQVSLCEIMVPCGYILYGTASISREALQQINEKIVAELLTWKGNLPQALQIDISEPTSPYPPHVLLLHMQYYQNLIYAHRPWMSKSYIQPHPPQGPGYKHARGMCIKSAIAIAKILHLYETQYTLRRINVKAISITSSAVLLLLFAAVFQYRSIAQAEIAMHLSTCFRALDEFAISWQNARRVKDLLMKVQKHWETRTRARKSARELEEDAVYSPRKRSKTSDSANLQTRPESFMDSGMDADLLWMHPPDGRGPCDGDLFSLISNPGLLDPELS